jgi:hypothetical protein
MHNPGLSHIESHGQASRNYIQEEYNQEKKKKLDTVLGSREREMAEKYTIGGGIEKTTH